MKSFVAVMIDKLLSLFMYYYWQNYHQRKKELNVFFVLKDNYNTMKHPARQGRFLVISWMALHLLFAVVVVDGLSSNPAMTTIADLKKLTPCLSPRFDTFIEKIFGDWLYQANNAEEEIMTTTLSVQEVMRSCGGAVQGIREVPTKKDEAEEGYYLNRANDGFLYFDQDGSYSCGPVNFVEQTEENPLWISSLTFGRTRLVMMTDDNQFIGCDDAECNQFIVCRKTSNNPFPTLTNSMKATNNIPGGIVWNEIVRSRMPSPSQPWMMQRLKWERCLLGEEVDNDDNDSSLDEQEPQSITSWMTKEIAPKGSILEACINNNGSEDSIVWSVGGICSKTGLAKSTIREYSHSDGCLTSVAWLRGRIPQS